MSDFDKKLNRHIEKVLELKRNAQNRQLTLEELKQIDLSMGITEKEWDSLMQKADKSVELAQSHFYYRNYHDAYHSAETAVSINPYHTQALIIMAESALKIYQAEDDDNFLQKAELHAREVLKQSPAENRAVEILATLNKLKSQEKTQRNKVIKITLAIVAAVFVVGGIIFFQTSREKDNNKKEKNDQLRFALINAEEDANAAWAQVENVISRRDNLIPQLFAAIENDPEITTKKEKLDSIKNKIEQAPEDEKIKLQAAYQTKIKALTALIRKKAQNDESELLLIQIEGAHNRIAVEGRRYNEVVKKYNILVKKHGNNYPEFKLKPYFKGE